MTSPPPEGLSEFASKTWRSLATTAIDVPRFDASTVDGLPPPAARLLSCALPDGAPLEEMVQLEMRGRIKLGRWLPFTARQILREGVGLVWAAQVGGRVLRFTGADVLGPEGARMEFRLHDRIPVVRQSGPGVVRSAAGRLAAETVAWLPQALTPQRGAHWHAIDDDRATVVLHGPAGPVEVDVTVDLDGHVVDIRLQRWNPGATPPAEMPFGGRTTSHVYEHGVCVSGAGTVGWGWGTSRQEEGTFFRYSITALRFGSHLPSSELPR